MVFWSIVCGALIGWGATGFEQWGMVAGGILAAPMGLWLRSAVRSEVRDAVRAALADVPIAATRAEPLAPPDPVETQLEPPRPARAAASRRRDSDFAATRAALAEPAAYVAEPQEPAEPSLAEQAIAAVRGWLFGGNTIVRVGLVLLFVGLSFLANYVASAGLFPIELRLTVIALAGLALLAVGFLRRNARPDFALALQGTGVAVLYLTVFAAARVFAVMPLAAAFGLMGVFCALGCTLALLQNSRTMALASFAGGFAVPLLLGGEAPTPLPLFSYYTILNLAILFIAWRRAWRSLNLLGFAATFAMATLWGMTSYVPQHLVICQIFLAVSVLIYLATAVLYAHNTPGRLGNAADSTLLFGPAIAGFGLEAGLVHDRPFASAYAALAFGAVYIAVAAHTFRQKREGMGLVRECLLAIGLGFVTLAVPLALEVKWTSAAWALEGAGAFWVGMRQARWMPRAFGLLLMALAAGILLNTLQVNVAALPILNTGFIGALLIAVPLLATAWWLRRRLPHSESRLAKTYAAIEAGIAPVVFLAGFGFVCLALILELTRHMPAADTSTWSDPAIAYAIQPLVIMLSILAAMWVAAWIGRRYDWAAARWPSLASLPLMTLVFLGAVINGRNVLDLPDAAIWGASLGLHLAMLRANSRSGGWTALVHAGTVWLLTAMLADCLQRAIDRAALWDTSWAGVIFLVAAIAVLMALTRWAGRAAAGEQGLRWPLGSYGKSYYWTAAAPLAALVFAGSLATALLAQGVTDPLPYIPLLNPVDLSLGLAMVAVAGWRKMLAPTGHLQGSGTLVAGAALAFAIVNSIWLRIAHHFLGVEWSADAMGTSPAVQTGLAILWTLMAMALMLYAHRRALRPVWLTGAGLLVVVTLKLLLIDMSNAQGWQRIVTFIGVGVLMLVIGYFVPLPPRQAEAEKTA